MTIQLVEGQSFSNDYSLLHSIGVDKVCDTWLALDEKNQQRVRLKIMADPLTDDVKQKLPGIISRQQGLLHPGILRTYSLGQFEATDFLVCQYIHGASEYTFDVPFATQWQYLKQVISAVEYAHSLGFTHGGICPANIIIDATGAAFLDDFGIAPLINRSEQAYLSPQLQQRMSPVVADDIYALGQMLFRAFTGNVWQTGQAFESDQPVPDAIKDLLLAMLAADAASRPTDFRSLVKLLDDFTSTDINDDSLAVETFHRATPTPEVAYNPASHQLPRDRNAVSASKALIALVILLIIGFGLFLFLPQSTPEIAHKPQAPHNPAPTQTAQAEQNGEVEPATPTLAPLELARLEQLKVEGKQLAEELLRRQIDLEDIGGRIWATENYDQSADLGLAGDDAYREEKFQLAVDNYRQAISLVNEAIDRVDEVFAENQALGEAALLSGDANTAEAAFLILSAIEPDNKSHQTNLKRAENLDEVQRLISDGEIIERNGDFQAALANYQQAKTLDPAWQPAVEAVRRVKQAITNQKFNDQMSKGFSNLNKENFALAREAFNAAQQLLPNSSEPEDGLQQVNIAELRKQTAALAQQAEEFSQQGNWQQAIEKFEEMLVLIPGSTVAEAGLKNAKARAQLDEKLNRFINEPHLMREDEELNTAKRALLEAARIKQPEDYLKAQINQLSHLISLARISIAVDLTSDNKTEVTVYRVGEFGKLNSKRLSLIPGIYTFVGKRPGYRDVYEEVAIKGDKPLVPVHISCNEKI